MNKTTLLIIMMVLVSVVAQGEKIEQIMFELAKGSTIAVKDPPNGFILIKESQDFWKVIPGQTMSIEKFRNAETILTINAKRLIKNNDGKAVTITNNIKYDEEGVKSPPRNFVIDAGYQDLVTAELHQQRTEETAALAAAQQAHEKVAQAEKQVAEEEKTLESARQAHKTEAQINEIQQRLAKDKKKLEQARDEETVLAEANVLHAAAIAHENAIALESALREDAIARAEGEKRDVLATMPNELLETLTAQEIFDLSAAQIRNEAETRFATKLAEETIAIEEAQALAAAATAHENAAKALESARARGAPLGELRILDEKAQRLQQEEEAAINAARQRQSESAQEYMEQLGEKVAKMATEETAALAAAATAHENAAKALESARARGAPLGELRILDEKAQRLQQEKEAALAAAKAKAKTQIVAEKLAASKKQREDNDKKAASEATQPPLPAKEKSYEEITDELKKKISTAKRDIDGKIGEVQTFDSLIGDEIKRINAIAEKERSDDDKKLLSGLTDFQKTGKTSDAILKNIINQLEKVTSKDRTAEQQNLLDDLQKTQSPGPTICAVGCESTDFYKKLKDDINKARDTQAKAEADLAYAQTFNWEFQTEQGIIGARQTIAIMRGLLKSYEQFAGIAKAGSLFLTEDNWLEWRNDVSQTLCDTILLGGKECWVSNVCDQYIDATPEGNSLIARTPAGIAVGAVHLQAEKSLPIDFVNETTNLVQKGFLYKITYTITNPLNKKMAYNLRFTKTNNQYYNAYSPNKELDAGGTDGKTGSAAKFEQSSNDYKEVCLVFDPAITTWDGKSTNLFCTQVSQYNGAATSPYPNLPQAEGTCDDKIQNQKETSTDCGGPCPACGTTNKPDEFGGF